jgi:lipopolysaccharide transport system permease protein
MHKVVITSQPDDLFEYTRKIWKYRALILVFAKRDLKVKYAQTFLGLGWTVLQPLTALLIFTFFFGYVLKWKVEGLAFPLYVLSGLLGWNFFSYIVYQGTSSVQDSSNLIKKIYFPKVILPLSKVCVSLVELSITVLLLIPLMIWHEQPVSIRLFLIPIVLLFNSVIALFVVFTISSLAYKMRDLFHLVPYVMYFGIWVTPVFFTKSLLPEQINFIWFLNPMASVVELWRWCLFPQWQFDLHFLPALLVMFPLFILSFLLYNKTEQIFSDFA